MNFPYKVLCSLFICGTLHAQNALLTDNQTSWWGNNTFPAEQWRIETGATLEWITTGPFASDPDIVKSGSRPEGKNRMLLDGRRGAEGNYQAFSSWGGKANTWVSFIIDLQGTYLVESAAIWTQQKDKIGSGSFEILLGKDKKNFVSSGSYAIDDKLRTDKDGLGVESLFLLEKPAAARYVQFRIKKRTGAWQQIISEIAVYGRKISAEKALLLSPEKQRPQVRFTLKGIQEAGVIIDWSDFAGTVSDVTGWKLYVSETPENRVDSPGIKVAENFPAKVTRKVFFPLAPGKEYYFGVNAVYKEGENPEIVLKKYTVPKPFAKEKLGDMLAINYYWGGGGEGVVYPHRHQKAWDLAAIELLGTTPIKQIRWWRLHKHVAELLYDQGIGMLSESIIPEIAAPIGVLTLGCGNEPELKGIPAAQWTDKIRKEYKAGKAYNPDIVVAAPAVNIRAEALNYLEDMYRNGLKECIDVLDLHTYGGNPKDNPELPGYPQGAPEFLFRAMEDVNAMLRKYGDENKPKISTEFGYTDGQIANPIGFPISREEIAQYLTRALIIHDVLDFKRVFIYSFWDSGINPNDTEQHFGMVDYYLQKKPSFYAVCTLGEQLGNCRLDSRMKGTDEKLVYGYNYRDITNDSITAVIWDGRGDYSGTFKTSPGKVEIIELLGKKSIVHTAADGTFRALYGPSVTYFKTPGPVELLKSVKVGKKMNEETGILFSPMRRIIEIMPGEKSADNTFSLQNRSGEDYQVLCILEDMTGKKLQEKRLLLPAGKNERITFRVSPGKRVLNQYRARLTYEGKYASYSTDETFFVRALRANDGRIHVSKKQLEGYEPDVIVITDDRLEVTVDPERGGRILEIWDKVKGGNQVNIAYDRLAGLGNINFYYTLWDRVRAPGEYAISPKQPFQAKLLPNGVRLSAVSPAGMKLEKILTSDGQGTLKMDVTMTNGGKDTVACSWYLHPEYTVGGSGDHGTDVLRLPIGGELLSMAFWNGLGHKPTQPFSEGFWKIEDTIHKVQLEQKFDPAKFRTPRLWFGIGCYNLEMESTAGLKLAPGESWNGTLSWTLSDL